MKAAEWRALAVARRLWSSSSSFLAERDAKRQAVKFSGPVWTFSKPCSTYLSQDIVETSLPRLQARDSAKWRPQGLGAFYLQKRFAADSSSNKQEDSTATETITVTFRSKDGDEKVIQVPLGTSMLEAAHKNDIDLEGACEGSLACSTCHVIVLDEEYYKRMPEPSDEENDMLDLAFALTPTSRLGCQVIAKKELDGIRLSLPPATRNFAVDGHVPKPH